MHLKNSIVSEKTCNFYKILGRGCPTSKSNYDWCLLLNLSLFKTSIWLTSLSVVRFSKFEILNRSTQKVTNNYQSVKIFKTVCDRRSRGRVFIPYCIGLISECNLGLKCCHIIYPYMGLIPRVVLTQYPWEGFRNLFKYF